MKLTDKNFSAEVQESEGPALVMFWGSWCPVCKRMQPLLEDMEEEFLQQGVKVGQVNIDQNPHTASRYKIKGTPTFYLFKGGEPVDMSVGAQTEKQLQNLLERNLNGEL